MTTKGKAIMTRDGGEVVSVELPPYAARYLVSMCKRERAMLNNMASTGAYSVAIDAAFDALGQIESALP